MPEQPYEQIWSQILAEIELDLTKPEFLSFFAGARLEEISDKSATISCRNNTELQFLRQERYQKLLARMLSEKNGEEVKKIRVHIRPEEGKKESDDLGPLFSPAANNVGLDPLCTMENFAVSSSNQLAYAAAQAVVKNPGRTYNPLFLWGGVGVGKTHLMQAIGHSVLKRDPNANLVFSMGEEFTNEIIAAIQNNTTASFKKRYRRAQLLMLDDIQFIADKVKVQEEFFHTFVSIKREGGQIVLTSDRPPNEIPELEARLRSRFEAGLIVDISQPNFELRTAIVLIKARQRGKQVPMSVARYLAEQIDDTRRLEGFLIRLLSEAEINRRDLSVPLAEELFGRVGNNSVSRPRVSNAEVLKKVASHFGITLGDLKGKKRSRPIVVPRQIAMYLLRDNTETSLEDIGALLGGRDHTTIMHGVDKVEEDLLNDPEWAGDILRIKSELWGKVY